MATISEIKDKIILGELILKDTNTKLFTLNGFSNSMINEAYKNLSDAEKQEYAKTLEIKKLVSLKLKEFYQQGTELIIEGSIPVPPGPDPEPKPDITDPVKNLTVDMNSQRAIFNWEPIEGQTKWYLIVDKQQGLPDFNRVVTKLPYTEEKLFKPGLYDITVKAIVSGTSEENYVYGKPTTITVSPK